MLLLCVERMVRWDLLDDAVARARMRTARVTPRRPTRAGRRLDSRLHGNDDVGCRAEYDVRLCVRHHVATRFVPPPARDPPASRDVSYRTHPSDKGRPKRACYSFANRRRSAAARRPDARRRGAPTPQMRAGPPRSKPREPPAPSSGSASQMQGGDGGPTEAYVCTPQVGPTEPTHQMAAEPPRLRAKRCGGHSARQGDPAPSSPPPPRPP
jgi:hypothetical protein